MTTDLAEGIILIVWGSSVVDKVNHVVFWEGSTSDPINTNEDLRTSSSGILEIEEYA